MANPTNGSACFVEMHLNTFQHDSAVDKLEMSNICSDTGYLAVSNNKKIAAVLFFSTDTFRLRPYNSFKTIQCATNLL